MWTYAWNALPQAGNSVQNFPSKKFWTNLNDQKKTFCKLDQPAAKSKIVPRRRASGFTSFMSDINSRNVQSNLKKEDVLMSSKMFNFLINVVINQHINKLWRRLRRSDSLELRLTQYLTQLKPWNSNIIAYKSVKIF